MADENTRTTITEEEKASIIRQLFNIVFEHIVPWANGSGDTGLTSRLKIQGNFEKIKAWIDSSSSFFLSRIYDDIAYGHITFNKGLTALATVFFGDYVEGLRGGIITEKAVAELKELWVREHTLLGDGTIRRDAAGKVIPALEVKGDSTFSGDLSSPEFISGFLGGLGWAIQKKEVPNAAGIIEDKYTLEIDNAVIRGTLRVFELVISQLLGENDNRVFTAMLEVDHYDPETGRVWLSTNGGRYYNPFRPGDYILVQQYQPGNDVASGGDGYITKQYELLVKEVGVGGMDDGNGDRLDWVTFRNFTTSMTGEDEETALKPEDLIREGDTFTRVDNVSDPDRKGIITMMTVGSNTPYMDVIYGMKTDQKHALKSRLGNLEGIITDVFGKLSGFGAYLNNLYGVGKFFNAQTGESLLARVEMSLDRFRSLYKETTYNISEEDNFLTNGFFQDGLEGWTVRKTDGSEPDPEEEPETLADDDGLLLVNGEQLAVEQRLTAEIVTEDGIQMLHLLNMGVAQDFSDIRENGTHDVMADDLDTDNTQTTEEPDALYFGVRILPVTGGILKVAFMKDGSSTGFERELTAALDWQLVQATDGDGVRWDYTGQGYLLIAYTGECRIRFAALTTDPVVNSRISYQTLFEQTSRRITQEASRITGLNEEFGQFQVQYNALVSTVSSNRDLSDRVLATLLGIEIDEDTGLYKLPETQLSAASGFATWRVQTNTSIEELAAEWDTTTGKIKNYSTTEQTSSMISGMVAGKADTTYVNSLFQDAETYAAEQAYAAKQELQQLLSTNYETWTNIQEAISDGVIDAKERGQLKALRKSLQVEYDEAMAAYSPVIGNENLKDTDKTALIDAHDSLVTAFGSLTNEIDGLLDTEDMIDTDQADSIAEAFGVFNSALQDYAKALENISKTIQKNIKDELKEAVKTARKTLQDQLDTIDAAITEGSLDGNGQSKYAAFLTWRTQTQKAYADYALAIQQDGSITNLQSLVGTVTGLTSKVSDYDNDQFTALLQKCNIIDSSVITYEQMLNGKENTVDWNSKLSGYATQQWVGEQGFALQSSLTTLETNIKNFKTANTEVSNAIKDGIIDAQERGQLKAIKTTLESDFASITAEYGNVHGNTYLNGTSEKTALANAYGSDSAGLKKAYNAVISAIDSLISSEKISDTSSVTSAMTLYNEALAAYQGKLEAAVRKISQQWVGEQGYITSAALSGYARTSDIEQLDSSIMARVQFVEQTGTLFTSDDWEQGTTGEETQGYTYSSIKRDSSSRIRTKDLVSVSLASRMRVPSGYEVDFIFFDSNKRVHQSIESDWMSPVNGSVSVGASATVAYVAILLRRTDRTNITPSVVTSLGLAFTRDNVVTEGMMGVYIKDEDGVTISHAVIKADKIDFWTNGWTVKNDDGDTTFQLDRNGNLTVAGTINGGKVVENLTVGRNGFKFIISPDDYYSNPGMYAAGIIGKYNSLELLRLGAITGGELKPSLELKMYSGETLKSRSVSTPEAFFVYKGSNGLTIGIGENSGSSYMKIHSDCWCRDSDKCEIGDLYVDGSGYVKLRTS